MELLKVRYKFFHVCFYFDSLSVVTDFKVFKLYCPLPHYFIRAFWDLIKIIFPLYGFMSITIAVG
jgi:hypothetical protein